MPRYALRMETADGTLEDAYHFVSNKALAVKCARAAAKNTACTDVVRIWVDDMQTDQGVASFKTKYSKGE